MSRSLRILAAILATTVLVGCAKEVPSRRPAAGPSPTLTFPGGSVPPLPPCEFPKKKKYPRWVPSDLPLPKGTYAMDKLERLAGYDRALLVIPMLLEELTTYVLEEWPKAGYALGAGDAEPGEIEDQFSKGRSSGAFKAQSVYCDPGFSIMYLIYAKQRPVPAPISSPRGSPLVPSPSG